MRRTGRADAFRQALNPTSAQQPLHEPIAPKQTLARAGQQVNRTTPKTSDKRPAVKPQKKVVGEAANQVLPTLWYINHQVHLLAKTLVTGSGAIARYSQWQRGEPRERYDSASRTYEFSTRPM